jgi:hypothetical protein
MVHDWNAVMEKSNIHFDTIVNRNVNDPQGNPTSNIEACMEMN